MGDRLDGPDKIICLESGSLPSNTLTMYIDEFKNKKVQLTWKRTALLESNYVLF